MATPIFNIQDIDLYNILIGFVTDNVTDIRTNRKNKRWVFDQYPENDSNYPECVVEINSSTPKIDSAAQFLVQEKNGSGNVIKEVYYMVEECPVKIRVLTLKDLDHKKKGKTNGFEVTVNSTQLYLNDKTANLYLNQKIKELFYFKYRDLIKNYTYKDCKIIQKIRVIGVDRVYEASDRVWASDIIVNIEFRNLYVKEYSDTGELINEYSLILNLQTD